MTLLHFCASRYIIGKKGETKKRLETETRTSISIPKPGAEGQIGEFNMNKMGVLSSALAQTRFEWGGGTGGVFPLIPASDMALTLWPWENHFAFLLSLFFLSINPYKAAQRFWGKTRSVLSL